MWHNQIDKALKLANKIIIDKEMIEDFSKEYCRYVMFLIVKKQYQYVADYFETPDLNLKERFKPLYYALLYFAGDKNYHKLPPEIAEPVAEIIEQIKQMEKDYA